MKTIIRWKIGGGGFIGEVSLFELGEYDDYVARKAGSACVMLSNLHVHPLRRGRGWGRILVETALAHAQKKGWCVFIRVVPYNDSTLDAAGLTEFYKSLGFKSMRHDKREMLWKPTKAK